MGMTNDWAIDRHNELMATDDEYAAGYAEAMAFDRWREEEFFRKKAEEEIYENFFDDYRISFDGYEEIDDLPIFVVDEEIPF